MTIEQRPTDVFRILIVGGGIAGFSAAVALRAENREILILEQSSLSREIGAAISLQPNASKIVEKQWALGDALKKRKSMIDEGFRIYTVDGKLQVNLDLMKKDYGGDRVVYHRQDLHETLKEAAISPDRPGNPAILRVSSRVLSCDCEKGAVTLENGQILQGFDLIVGADGIRSRIRESVLNRQVKAVPTGWSAYRTLIPMSVIDTESQVLKFMNPRDSYTTMVMGYDRRLIMGPVRQGEIYSICAMVPNEAMQESSDDNSWTSEGNPNAFLESFAEFPDWCKSLFKHAPELGLWQLRDMDPLETWVKGRVIIIGDASHPMLPTQGQGASQSVEDAEAVGAFFADLKHKPSVQEIHARLQEIMETRRPRTTTIQHFSRQTGKPATEKGGKDLKRSEDENMDFNCSYDGAKDWQRRQKQGLVQVI